MQKAAGLATSTGAPAIIYGWYRRSHTISSTLFLGLRSNVLFLGLSSR